MRVNIEHGTKTTGLFKKTTFYTVTLKVDFTEEERAVLTKAQLTKHLVLEREMRADINDTSVDPDIWNLRVYHLLAAKPDEHVVRTLGQAQAYEEELKEAMQDVKSAIDANRDVKVESKSFEL